MKNQPSRWRKARLGWRDQDGFNLLGALIIVSLVVMVTYLVTQSQGLTMRAKRSVRAAGAYEEIIQPFQSAIVEKLKTHFNVPSDPGCPQSATFASGMIGQNFRFNYAAPLPDKVQDPDALRTVKAACRSPSFQDGQFHFCLAINPIKAERKTDNNMSSMSDIIADLNITLLNVQDDQVLTCTAFYNGRTSYTVRIDYTLFWLYNAQTQSVLKKRRGTFYAIL